MQKIRNLFILSFFLSIVFGFSQMQNKRVNTVVEGIVLSDNTGKPVSNTHVYIVHGEEEALTNAKGEFRIETSRSFPLPLAAEHEGYQKFKSTVSHPGQKQVIKLRSK